MKTIIVPLDFSEESFNGLNLAVMLAKKTGSGILMVHVIAKDTGENPGQEETALRNANKRFEEVRQRYAAKDSFRGSLNYTVAAGQVFKEVENLAAGCEDPLTVLSTHGTSGFEELFIGGNAYKITSHSTNPVITVRKAPVSSHFSRIVLPLDITFQTREKVPYTVELAKLFNAEIHLLTIHLSNLKSINRKLLQYAGQVAGYLEKNNVPCTINNLQGSNLTDLTLDYAKSVNADLISIMTEQEKSASNLLLGSFAHQMINKSHIPVLLFPNYRLRIIAEDIWTLGAFNPR